MILTRNFVESTRNEIVKDNFPVGIINSLLFDVRLLGGVG